MEVFMDNDELLIVIKDLFEKKTDEIKSYVDEKINGQSVLIERLQGDIKAVAEGHDTLYRKIDSLDKKVDSLDKKVDSLDKKVDDRTNELKTEIKVLENYIIGVDAKLNEHDVIFKRVK
jgi:peptidoglycan hydrolase CwlO-like protein